SGGVTRRIVAGGPGCARRSVALTSARQAARTPHSRTAEPRAIDPFPPDMSPASGGTQIRRNAAHRLDDVLITCAAVTVNLNNAERVRAGAVVLATGARCSGTFNIRGRQHPSFGRPSAALLQLEDIVFTSHR